MINVLNVNKKFDTIEVLRNVSFKMNKGEVISIIGPSGSGKSTLLRCLIGLVDIDNGEIEVNGTLLTAKKSDSKTKMQALKKMGMVFQNFNLFPHKTVLENMIEAPIFVGKMSKADAISLSDELLAKVGLSDKRNSYPNQLSGGQKQRVAIARALALKPEVLFFDEPTSALDPELVGEVLSVIKELSNEDMTMIIVTHEMAFAKEVSDRILFMDQGEVLCDSSPEILFTNPSNARVKSFINSLSYNA